MKSEATIPQTGNMVLRSEVLRIINVPKHRVALAGIMKVGEQAISKYIDRNDVKLTQYAPLQYIQSVMGCLETSELLQPETE